MATTQGLTRRIALGQAVVVGAGLASGAIAALVVGPQLFHAHVLEAGIEDANEIGHLEQAFQESAIASVTIALIVSVLAAFAFAAFVGAQIQKALGPLSASARDLARGNYETRAPTLGITSELDDLALTFNTMAERLEHTEDIRRHLLADLAHELRTPIAVLAAHHEALRDGIVTFDEDVADVLEEQTKRLTRLAQDLREVSTAEESGYALQPAVERVDTLVRAAALAAKDAAEAKGVGLYLDPIQSDLLTSVDRQRIGQVLANLLANAIRHTPAGGSVTLGADEVRDEVAITVTDTGEGLTPEATAQIFERFYRGDSARELDRAGTGIGLTISRSIARAHGGGLTASSEGPGMGSVLTLTLPRA